MSDPVMKRHSVPSQSLARFCRTTLCLAFGLFSYGALAMPPVAAIGGSTLPTAPVLGAATGTPVNVDQTPLTVQPDIPPNIVLMLDDSGSMNYDVMPDWDSLPAPNWSPKNWNYFQTDSVAPLINSSINGVYYNPTITYVLPPKADGTLYTDATFDAALINGFDSGSKSVDISLYRGLYDSEDTYYEGSSVQYSISVAKTGATSYAPDHSCTDIGGNNSNKYSGWCYFADAPNIPFNFYDTSNNDFYVSKCDSISDVYDDTTKMCTPGISFFTYTTSDSDGGYTRHYVAKNTGDCSAVGLTGSVCTADPVVQQNVANWFSYYHTRILMAKSGLMRAFDTLSPKYRFGFGSINNRNKDELPSPAGWFNGKKIAEVQVFGDGSAGTQKEAFWDWVATTNPGNSTPLRNALKAVGEYYQTSQPWSWMTTDPGFSNKPSDAGSLACRQSNVILTTDGFWNGGDPSGIVAGTTNKDGPSFVDGNGHNVGYTATPPYSGGGAVRGSDAVPSLADVATYYWENDLSDIDNEVPTNSSDPAFWQHMVTFTLGMGFPPVNIAPAGTTTKEIFDWANGGTAITDFSWPTPSPDDSGSPNNIADLVHAGVNGHGGFFSASDPQSFVSSIEAALKRASERVAGGASVGANSTKLSTGTFVYQSQYYTSSWRGDLLAIGLDPVTGIPKTMPAWSASQVLNGMASVDGNLRTYPHRKVYTYNTSTDAPVPFKNGTEDAPPGLSDDQLASLGSNAAEQAAMVNYLRGDNTNDQSNNGDFRTRSTPLGDIVDSTPVYVGAPDATVFNSESFPGLTTVTVGDETYSPYYRFVSDQVDRQGVVYVAGNDGMLHAFNADTGKELYAYLPGALLINQTDPVTGLYEPLTNLSLPNYGSDVVPHQYYNDGKLTVASAYVKLDGETDPSWHTILVGTTGHGPARAVYALDVTDPSNIKPLWERYAGDDSSLDSNSGYIGQMVGTPTIAQTSSGEWSVLMGNGYNSPKGVAALLQFDLATGELHVHTTNADTGNGLAGAYTWMTNASSGITDLAYGGDLEGHVWQFNLNSTNCTGSGKNQTCTTTATPDSVGTHIFTAMDADGNVQPITSTVVMAKNPTDQSLWLFFGTGSYMNQDDLNSDAVQTWYGLIVTPDAENDNAAPTNLTGRDVLAQRSIIYEDTGSTGGFPARAVTPMPSTPEICGSVSGSNGNGGGGDCKLGWYMDLVSPTQDEEGERMTIPNQFQGGLLVGTTMIPQPGDQPFDPCTPAGAGWLMALDPFTGTNPAKNFFDRNGNGIVGYGDSVTIGTGDSAVSSATAAVRISSLPTGTVLAGGNALVSTTAGKLEHVPTGGGSGSAQRVSWRELVNP